MFVLAGKERNKRLKQHAKFGSSSESDQQTGLDWIRQGRGLGTVQRTWARAPYGDINHVRTLAAGTASNALHHGLLLALSVQVSRAVELIGR